VEQLAKLADVLKQLGQRQEKVLEETQRIAAFQTKGELTRGQTASLRSLADQQGLLRADTEELGEGLAGAGAFRLTLSRAAGHMGEAAALLARSQTATPTQDAQRRALDRIDLLLEALKPEPPEDSPPGGGAGGQPPPGGRPAAVQLLAELKLLKLLQEKVNRRTAQLQESVEAAGAMTDEQRREFAALSEEQGRLADLTWQLLQVHGQGPEDGLEEPPQ
jgi:hypothetical protein